MENRMKTSRLATALLLACTFALAACNRDDAATGAGTTGAPERTAGTEVTGAIEKARQKLDKGNISVSGDHAAKAEITPAGDLLIDGRTVAITPEQRKLLLEYRAHVVGVASAGMDIGVQGATLAAKAVGEALRGAITGDTESIEQRVEEQAAGVKDAALRLCDHLPAMLASQQKLAAALPEFEPYATMTQADIDECRSDAAHERTAPSASPKPEPVAG